MCYFTFIPGHSQGFSSCTGSFCPANLEASNSNVSGSNDNGTLFQCTNYSTAIPLLLIPIYECHLEKDGKKFTDEENGTIIIATSRNFEISEFTIRNSDIFNETEMMCYSGGEDVDAIMYKRIFGKLSHNNYNIKMTLPTFILIFFLFFT